MPIKINPVLYAAFGASVFYYCLFPLYRSNIISVAALLIFIFAPVAALCFFRVLASFPLNKRPLIADTFPQTARKIKILPLRLTAFAAGMALGTGAAINASAAVYFGIPENTVIGITGIMRDDPRLVSGGRAMAEVSLKMGMGSGGVRATARGETTVFFPEESAGRLREFGRGAEIFAEGNLRRGTGGSGALLFSAETLHVTKTAPPLERFRTGLRLGLTQRFTDTPSGDRSWGGMALALLLGIRDNLDTGIAAMYRDAGCSHILALSGMHLAVLVGLISFLLKKPLGLRAAALAGSGIIIAYCFLVGPLPSLNRAALMYLLGAIAILGMLERDVLSVLCMAFLIQLAFTPKAGNSLSFILSYLALAGILVIGESINGLLKGKIPVVILQSVSASLGAFIATAGVSAWFFETLRPVGIIAGLALAPLAMVYMVAAMVWLGAGLLIPALSPLLEKPLILLYRLMEKIASLSAHMPGMRVNPYLVLSVSAAVAALIIVLEHRRGAAEKNMEPFD
jgi:competence protein ComEC